MRKFWVGLLTLGLSLLVVSVWAYAQRRTPTPDRRPVARPNFDLEVLINGQPAEEYRLRGRGYVEALAGEEYELLVRNPLGVRVAVALSVDGLNTIDARRDTAFNASKWVIEPYGVITIRGWQMSDTRARRFYFTSERDSYANKIGQGGNFGVISAVFFQERRPVVVERPIPISPGRKEPRQDRAAAEAPAASNVGADAKKSRADDDYAATGIGRDTRYDVTRTQMDLDPQPVNEATLRYEFRDALIRLGVVPRPRHLEPLQRRENSNGFERGRYSPEP